MNEITTNKLGELIAFWQTEASRIVMSHYVFHSALERHAERAIEENNKAVLRTLLYLNTNISEEDDNYERDNIERLLKEHPEAVYAETLEWYSTEIKK